MNYIKSQFILSLYDNFLFEKEEFNLDADAQSLCLI